MFGEDPIWQNITVQAVRQWEEIAKDILTMYDADRLCVRCIWFTDVAIFSWMVREQTKLAISKKRKLASVYKGIMLCSIGISITFFLRETNWTVHCGFCRHSTRVGGSIKYFMVHTKCGPTTPFPVLFSFLYKYFANSHCLTLFQMYWNSHRLASLVTRSYFLWLLFVVRILLPVTTICGAQLTSCDYYLWSVSYFLWLLFERYCCYVLQLLHTLPPVGSICN